MTERTYSSSKSFFLLRVKTKTIESLRMMDLRTDSKSPVWELLNWTTESRGGRRRSTVSLNYCTNDCSGPSRGNDRPSSVGPSYRKIRILYVFGKLFILDSHTPFLGSLFY